MIHDQIFGSILEFRISDVVEEKLSTIDSFVIWDPEELDLIHKTQAVDFVIQSDDFNGANFEKIQGKNIYFWKTFPDISFVSS